MSWLEKVGLRRSLIGRESFSKLKTDVPTLDFSGWPTHTQRGAPDSLITDFCRASVRAEADLAWPRGFDLSGLPAMRDTP